MQPKVFLSHSAADKPFIMQLYNDLKTHGLDPWIDIKEIRMGKSWMNEIFEQGIRNSHAVLIYYTENAIKSTMVGKELDSAFISQLSDKNIAVIPLVERAELRDSLRWDIRALQCNEFNSENYNEVLPLIVSEIWQSYTELAIAQAVLKEKNERLEIELKLTKLQNEQESSPFTPAEDADFQSTFDFLNFNIYPSIRIVDSKTEELYSDENFEINCLELIKEVGKKNSINYGDSDYYKQASSQAISMYYTTFPEKRKKKRNTFTEISSDVTNDLYFKMKMFNFFSSQMFEKDNLSPIGGHILRPREEVEVRVVNQYSEKFYRFMHWIVFQEHNYENPSYRPKIHVAPPNQLTKKV